jgi:hypothetical protein
MNIALDKSDIAFNEKAVVVINVLAYNEKNQSLNSK